MEMHASAIKTPFFSRFIIIITLRMMLSLIRPCILLTQKGTGSSDVCAFTVNDSTRLIIYMVIPAVLGDEDSRTK